MMRSVLRQDGEVKWVEENRILKENDGVGASLRFRFLVRRMISFEICL